MRVVEENFVSCEQNSEVEWSVCENEEIDPLRGTAEETCQVRFHRLDAVVFTEPVYVQGYSNTDSTHGLSSSHEDINREHMQEHTSGEDLSEKERNNKVDRDNTASNPFRSRKKAKVLGHRCAVCDEKFAHRYQLRRHEHVHSNTRRECPICRKMLSVRTQLSVHMRSHTSVRDFTCTQCGRGFTRRAALATHARFVHRRQDSLACAECSLSFMRRVELHRHRLERHARARLLACEQCGRMFSTLAALGAHRVKTHVGLKDTVKPRQSPELADTAGR